MNICKPPTCIVIERTDSTNLYKLSTCIFIAKTDSRNFYMPPTTFRCSENGFSEPLQQSKRSSRTSTSLQRLCVSQNGVNEPLQASKHCCSQNRQYEPLYMLLTGCLVVKMESTYFHDLATIFAAAKTDSTNLYKPPTRYAIVKTDSRNLYKLPTSFCCSENRLP